MKHQRTFPISDQSIKKIKQSDSPKETFDLVKNEMVLNEMVLLLREYYHRQDKRAEIFNVYTLAGEINNVGEGWMNVQYDVHCYTIRDGLYINIIEEMNFEISIDLSRSEITLVGENEEERLHYT